MKWNEIVANTSDFIFRKKFRMTKETFAVLAEKICSSIGEKTFRPAAKCHDGFISGEVRMAISICMLSGGSYLDLMGVTGFGIKSSGHIYHIFHDFIGWLHDTFDFPLVHMLRAFDLGDKEALAALHQISMQFANDSNGHFLGCIGALDGLCVRIKSPSLKDVPDPGNYFSRKNFLL